MGVGFGRRPFLYAGTCRFLELNPSTEPRRLLFSYERMSTHRGYEISVYPRFAEWLVYMSPVHPWLPIFSAPKFVSKGSKEDAQSEAKRRIDQLLTRTMQSR